MARLANNEALYLRREDLPAEKEERRHLLIDTTLRMWGLSRVFAVSAGLAITKRKDAPANSSCILLGSTSAKDATRESSRIGFGQIA